MSAARRIARAIERHADGAGHAIAARWLASEPWRSATFAGARHRFALESEAPLAAAWLAALPDAEWSIAGLVVADLAVTGDQIELLVLDAN